MKKLFFYVLMPLIGIFQLFPGEKPTVTLDNPNDIHREVLIDPTVSKILRNACYDCHSNETVYPWYAGIAPISWLVIHDTNEGREELNFSEWIPYTLKRKNHKLEEIIEMVDDDEMPMKIYTVIHEEAKLTEEDKQKIITWAMNLKGSAE
jgi:hypothetical protein